MAYLVDPPNSLVYGSSYLLLMLIYLLSVVLRHLDLYCPCKVLGVQAVYRSLLGFSFLVLYVVCILSSVSESFLVNRDNRDNA